MKKTFRRIIIGYTTFLLIFFVNTIVAYCSDRPWNHEHDTRMTVYMLQGVNPQIAFDQAIMDMGGFGIVAYNRYGDATGRTELTYGFQTGGLDGLYEDGTPAKNPKGGRYWTDDCWEEMVQDSQLLIEYVKPYIQEYGIAVNIESLTGLAKSQVPLHSHTWELAETKESTCKDEGKEIYKCSGCGKTKTNKLPLTEHDYVLREKVIGTCIEPTKEIYVCKLCNLENEVVGCYEDHDYERSKDSTLPTCNESGWEISVCKVCGGKLKEEIMPFGHDFPQDKEVVEQPTCTENGTKVYICQRCGETKDEEMIEASGHIKKEEVDLIKPATFFMDGEGEYRCANCELTMEIITIPANGGICRYILLIGGALILMLVLIIIISKIRKRDK